MSGRRRLGLFVFIDAFGWENLGQRSFLDDVLVTKAPLNTVFGYSSTCVPTILTGKLPRDHGHFAFFCFTPHKSPFGLCRYLQVLPTSITRRGRVRRLLSRILRRRHGYTGYFQIYNVPLDYLPYFEYSEQYDLYQRGGINSGVPTIFDHLRDHEVPFYLSDWRATEEANLRAINAALEKDEVAFAYLYLGHLDALLHQYGAWHPIVDEKVQWYDRQLRGVLARACKRYDTVNLYVFSDHGMTDVIDHCDLIPQITRTGLRFGVDYGAMYDGTMARFWFRHEGARRKIVEALEREPRGRILSDETLREYGCDFPTNRYGDLFFLLDPGGLLCPSFTGETPLAAMHGYDPCHRDSIAMFASNVAVDPMPQRLDDVYAVMLRETTGL